MNKKGTLQLDIIKKAIVGFLILVIIAIVIILALASFKDSIIGTIITDGTTEAYGIKDIVFNTSAGFSDSFFNQTGTIFSILIVIIIIAAIALVIFVVMRFGDSNNSTDAKGSFGSDTVMGI